MSEKLNYTYQYIYNYLHRKINLENKSFVKSDSKNEILTVSYHYINA